MDVDRRLMALRAVAAAAVLLLVPLVVTATTFSDEAAIVQDQPAPRTIEAERRIEVDDPEATQNLRAEAAADVGEVRVADTDAVEQTITAVQSVFTAVRQARQPVDVPDPQASPDPDGSIPTRQQEPTAEAQVEVLRQQVDVLEQDALRSLVELSDAQLDRVETNAIAVVQEVLRERFTADEQERIVPPVLDQELALRSPWPNEVDTTVVEPLINQVLQPTVTIDDAQTEQLRETARDSVETQTRVFSAGQVVIEAGEEVSAVQFEALERLGEVGSQPGIAFLRALVAMILVVAVVGVYLARSEPMVWRDPGRLFVLASVIVLSAVLLAGVEVLADTFGAGWWFAYPVGGIVLLVSVLISPAVGAMSVLPLAGVALLLAPSLPALAIFVTAMVVLAAPMANNVSTRVGLRRASVRAAAAAPVVAAGVALVFGPRGQYEAVLGAAILGGITGAGLLQGLLPAFENVFRLATVTALLDLADRNHPLLRELEAKAIGSYNHSVMVASLTERCCREIGANHLLGQVAALYHDIGKVRQPHFFIENQRGIANPHDDLEPRVSAVIIQNHVKDGVELAERHRLPPDVVSCIASHHGTMLVGYFYQQAIAAADGDEAAVDEQHFRYPGHKPRSKEAAILLLADCCEATTRAMAMDRGTLPSDEIEQTVDKLLRQRLEDGQFEECDLTFVELQRVRDTLLDALTGIYHPRIQYPGDRRRPPDQPDPDRSRGQRGAAVPS